MITEPIFATRLNGVVAAYRGHSRGELIVIGLLSLMTALITLSLLTRLLLGWWMLGVGLSFPASVFIAWMVVNVLERYKVGKPRGYLKCRFRCYLEDHGILTSPYVRRSGTWSIRREWRNN